MPILNSHNRKEETHKKFNNSFVIKLKMASVLKTKKQPKDKTDVIDIDMSFMVIEELIKKFWPAIK